MAKSSSSDSDKYEQVEISKDPADYLNGPTGNLANRGSGGTTRDGQVQTITVDETPRANQTTATVADTDTGSA